MITALSGQSRLGNFKGENMKYSTDVEIRAYNGEALLGQDNKPSTVRKLFEKVCVNADPQEFSSLEAKMEVHRLLMKVHQAGLHVDLTAEEVSLLKRLSAKFLSVVALGAIVQLLENPVTLPPHTVEASPA